jgi:hypothetical protein
VIRPRRIRRLARQGTLKVLRPIVDWLFHRRALAKLLGRTHVLCIGDSNVMVLRGIDLPGVWLYRIGLGGATVSGIQNPDPAALSSDEIGPRLARAQPWHQVLFMLGGVDCSFVIWYYARERGVDAQDLLRDAVEGYGELIRQTIARGFRRVLVVSPPLPTMGDSERPANFRGSVEATQLERTRAVLEFNAAIERRCRELGAEFVDVTSEQLDPDTGLIARRFVREDNKRNHHLALEPYRDVVARKLAALNW